MPEPPPRKRFQIHLSTAIVLMFVAGALIWANVRKHTSIYYVSSSQMETVTGYGWPMIAYEPIIRGSMSRTEYEISYKGLGTDLVLALVILLLVMHICEDWIEYRTKLKGPPSRTPDP